MGLQAIGWGGHSAKFGRMKEVHIVFRQDGRHSKTGALPLELRISHSDKSVLPSVRVDRRVLIALTIKLAPWRPKHTASFILEVKYKVLSQQK